MQVLHRKVPRVVRDKDQTVRQGDGGDEEIGECDRLAPRRPLAPQEAGSFGHGPRDVVVLEAVQQGDRGFTLLRPHPGEDFCNRDGRVCDTYICTKS